MAGFKYCIGRYGGTGKPLLCRGDPIFHEFLSDSGIWVDADLVGLYDGDMWAWRINEETAKRVETGELTAEEAMKYEIT